MSDIDILVRKSDLPKAKEQLLGLGYSPINEVDIATACAYSQHLPRMIKQDAPPVELHWTIEAPTFPFTIDIEGLWQQARPASVAGVDALTLSPEDLLLHQCLHTSAHHLFSNGLRALCDIRETIRHYWDEINWEELMLRARQWGAGNAVYLTLHFAESLLGADVPVVLLNKLRPENCAESVAKTEAFIFSGPDIDRQLFANHQARNLFASRSAAKTAGLFLQRIFLPREKISQLYDLPVDSMRLPLYYPVRLKDLIIRHNSTVWRIWRRDKAISRQFQLIDWLSR